MFPWVWMVLGTLYDIWYQIVPGKWIVDSDLAAEMVLSNHLNQTHRVLSKDWFYSTELRVFESQWFYRVGLLFSPDNWHVARVIAAVLMYIVFIAVTLFFAKSIGLRKYAPWVAAILMWPFGRWYLVYGLYGTYYLVYMMFSMAVTGVILHLCQLELTKDDTRRRKVRIAVLYFAGLFCSLASGLNGIKQTMVYFLPLVLSGIVLLSRAAWQKKVTTFSVLWHRCRKETLFAANSILFSGTNIVGYLINVFGLSRIYAFDSYDYMVFLDERPCRLYDIWMDFLRLFGYEGNVKVLSGGGIASILGMVFAGCFLICLVRLCRRFDKLEMAAQLVVLNFIFGMLVGALVYCTMGYYKVYYWLPMIPFAIAMIVLEMKTEEICMRGVRGGMLVAIALILPVISYGTVKQETENPLFTTRGYRELTDFLLENDLTEGYASFWSSSVLREMSSDRIQTWTLYNVQDNFVKYGWLQEKEKMQTEPEGRCFLIINEVWDDEAKKSALVNYGSGELIYEDGTIKVYEFENPEKIQQAADAFLETL
jgi:hypothetical protein